VSTVFVATARLPTVHGIFTLHGFEDQATGLEHVALTMGNLMSAGAVLARVHSECLTGDALFSQRCDCGAQLEEAMQAIAREGRGVILYLRQEGRGIGLMNKLKAYELQDQGADTVEANERLGFAPDLRQYDMCAPMLRHLGVTRLRLMTNNPRKLAALQELDIDVVERLPLQAGKTPHNAHYIATKVCKLGHIYSNA